MLSSPVRIQGHAQEAARQINNPSAKNAYPAIYSSTKWLSYSLQVYTCRISV